MDVDTAINHRRRLQSELDAIINHSHGLPLPISRKLLAIEIARLDQQIPSEYMRSVKDVSMIKIPVENPLLMLQLSLDFELSDVASLQDFMWQLLAERLELSKLHPQPLPLTFQFSCRVNDHLNEEMTQQLAKEISFFRAPPPPRSGGWQEYVDICINDAIDFIIKNDPEGGLLQVLRRLEEDPSIEVDYNVQRLVHQRYFEMTSPRE